MSAFTICEILGGRHLRDRLPKLVKQSTHHGDVNSTSGQILIKIGERLMNI